MRKILVFLALHLALLGGISAAGFEIVADDMRDIEDTLKDLDSEVSMKNPKATDHAKEVQAYFEKVEGFYAGQADKPEGVKLSQATRSAAAEVVQAAQGGDFDAAGSAVARLTRSCKACHDVYRQK